MKIKQNRIYPYPVYSELTNDYNNNDFTAEIELEYDSELATINITPILSNEAIIELLENDYADLYCHIECSSTKYRELFDVDYIKDKTCYQIQIPLYKLNDTVEIVCVIVTKTAINDFHSSNLNEIYEGETISFPKYATIGYTSTTEFVIAKRIDINGDVPSIFAINKDENANKITYDYANDQIVIFLPADEYQIYYDYMGQGTRVKQMMINLPVLIDVINHIKKDKASFEDRPWYTVLEAAYTKKGFDGFDENFMAKDSVELSQMILGDISKDAFIEFDKMNRER